MIKKNNFPHVRIIEHRGKSVGGDVIDLIRNHCPWPRSSDSPIELRWGQQTGFPSDKDIVIFDCGYFSREYKDGQNRHFRISINELHPTNLPPAPGDRFEKLNLELEDLFDPDGHVLLVGRGGKTRRAQSGKHNDWEQLAYKKIMKALPEAKVIYRPKKNTIDKIKGAKLAPASMSIRELCKGCSLIYTQRSNVGNEGLLYGIPVVTEGGPAGDVCQNTITPGMEPLPHDVRLDFLQRLAYWQWSFDEMRNGEIWPWLLEQIEARSKLKR